MLTKLHRLLLQTSTQFLSCFSTLEKVSWLKARASSVTRQSQACRIQGTSACFKGYVSLSEIVSGYQVLIQGKLKSPEGECQNTCFMVHHSSRNMKYFRVFAILPLLAAISTPACSLAIPRGSPCAEVV